VTDEKWRAPVICHRLVDCQKVICRKIIKFWKRVKSHSTWRNSNVKFSVICQKWLTWRDLRCQLSFWVARVEFLVFITQNLSEQCSFWMWQVVKSFLMTFKRQNWRFATVKGRKYKQINVELSFYDFLMSKSDILLFYFKFVIVKCQNL